MALLRRWLPCAVLIFVGSWLIHLFISTNSGPYNRCDTERFGTVINVETWPLHRMEQLSDGYRITVKFEYIGGQYEAPIYIKGERPPAVGERMLIRFDKENPTWAVNAKVPRPSSKWILFWGSVLFIAGLSLTYYSFKVTQLEHENALMNMSADENQNEISEEETV